MRMAVNSPKWEPIINHANKIINIYGIFFSNNVDMLIGKTIDILIAIISGVGVYYFTAYIPMKILKDRKSKLFREYLMKFTKSIALAYNPAYCSLKVFSEKYDDKAFTKRELSDQIQSHYKLLEISVDVLRCSYSEFLICYATIEEFVNPKTRNKIKELSLNRLYDDIIARWTDLVMYKESHNKMEFSKEAMEVEYNLHDSISAFMESLDILEKLYPKPYNTGLYCDKIDRIDIK